jgi:hypothetical protein
VGVEPTTRLAKSRINGFEGHEDHRTPFASTVSKGIRIRALLNHHNFASFGNGLRCYWGAIHFDTRHGLVEI